MKIKIIIAILLVFGIGMGFSSVSAEDHPGIPAWVKGVANFWAQGNISDDEFLEAIEFLIDSGIIVIDQAVEDEYYEDDDYPEEYYPDEEIKITQIGDEYWSCYLQLPVSDDCLPYDEKYFVGGINDLVYISGYNVVCDPDCELSLDIHYDDVDKKLEKFQSEKLHQEIFDAYLSVTPQVILDELVYFSITTDDYFGNEGAVTLRDYNNPLKMELSIDPVDAAPNGTVDVQFFKSLMIHENAHMFSLLPSQGDDDTINPETDAEMITLMKTKQAACDPNYYNDLVGCMNSDSYLNLFFQEFWVDVYPNFKWDYEFDTDEAFYAYEDAFIEKYEDQFITYYAMSMPDEDFAESFTAFVLLEKPTGNGTVDQKILFFYDFAEIVEMRDFIRSNL